MENKQGIITQIDEPQVGNKWIRYCYHLGDKKYSTFDTKIWEKNFKVGDKVIMSGEQGEKYWNMKTMRLAESDDADTASVSPLLTEVPITSREEAVSESKRGNLTIRQSCLKAAVRFFRADKDIGTEVVLACAEQFVDWVNKDGNNK